MANQNGIFIVLKAWLPVTGSISEQIAKLQMVEAAHTSGDYAELLKAATVEEIKTEQKTRRIEDAVPAPAGEPQLTGSDANEEAGADTSGLKDEVEPAGDIDANKEPTDDAVPQFLKGKRKSAEAA